MPALHIVLAVEAKPDIRVVCANESEEKRLHDWVASHDELTELVLRALDLADEQPAA